MSILDEVKEYIQSHRPATLDQLFDQYGSNLDAIIVAIDLLGWDKAYIKEMYENSIKDSKIIQQKIDLYGDSVYLSNLLLPKNLHVASILFYHNQCEELMKKIVDKLSVESDYISSIMAHDLIEKNTFFFCVQVDIKNNPKYLEYIHEKINNLEIIFVDDGYKDLFKAFKLNLFLSPDIETQESFVKVVEENKDEALFPIATNHEIKFADNNIFYTYNPDYVFESIWGIDSNFKIDLTKAKDRLIEKFKDEVLDEGVESAAKLALSASMGIGALDIGIKAAKILITSLYEESTYSLGPSQVNRDVIEFKASGYKEVKDWYQNKIRLKFNKAMTDSKISDQEVSLEFLDKSYSNYINRYFQISYTIDSTVLGPNSPLSLVQNMSHTELVLAIYECFNNQVVRLDSSSII